MAIDTATTGGARAGPATPVAAGDEPHGLGALTQRELAVMRLLAAGRSSKEIAAELVLSVRTVEWHMRNLHRKLGTSGRRQLVAAAWWLNLPATEEKPP